LRDVLANKFKSFGSKIFSPFTFHHSQSSNSPFTFHRSQSSNSPFTIHHSQSSNSPFTIHHSQSSNSLFTIHHSPFTASKEDFWALKDVSFEIKQGERVGIIGRNGAGKTTLLKLLSRITEPTTGRITLKGRVASLLEVGTGLNCNKQVTP